MRPVVVSTAATCLLLTRKKFPSISLTTCALVNLVHTVELTVQVVSKLTVAKVALFSEYLTG